MNAVIALCHFCEAHGPSAIFCTQTLRDTKKQYLPLGQSFISNKICSACTSLGDRGLYSKDNESGSIFLSTQNAIVPEVAALVQQASVRSLSCENNYNKDGGLVFFGDTRGHVMSYTFHVNDIHARGFYQLFSIIILMKDKYFLLNTKPFVAQHLRKVSTEIQALAQKVKKHEETKGSSRQNRLSGSQILVQSSRSLVNLTGEDNIFHILHSHFAWLLLAASRCLTEHITFGNLPWLPPQSSGRPPQQFLTYNIKTLPMIKKYEDAFDDPEQEEQLCSLRHIKQVVPKEFAALCYCALTGVKIIIHGSPERTFNLMISLTKLLPEQMHHLIRIDAQHQHSISSEYKIISVSNKIAVPAASSSLFRIDFVDNLGQASVTWPGKLPNKLPQLLSTLIKAVDEPRFTDLVINKQTKVLVEEWKNKVICLNRARYSNSICKLIKVIGVQPQDQQLINYWATYLQPQIR